MMPGKAFFVALAMMSPLTAQAADADPAPPTATARLKLEVARPVELECETKSVVVAENAANATNGPLKLTLLLKDDATRPASGSWRIASVGPAHTGSFGVREAKVCAESCPLSVGEGGNVELWAPAAKGLDALKPGERLLIAIVKADTLALRASTFSGKEIESLEEGTCRTGTQ